MTEIAAVMVIWFGSLQYAQFDTERYPSMAECEAAKSALVSYAGKGWARGNLSESTIECVPISAPLPLEQ